MDLYVVAPDGKKINQLTPKNGGWTLNRDACVTDSTCKAVSDTHPHVEHIYLDSTKKIKGTYSVWAENDNGTTAADYTVVFEDPNGKRTFKRGTIKAKENQKSAIHSFKIGTDSECEKDTDGDGLCDKWETDGMDVNGDGVIDLDLKKLGANPNTKTFLSKLIG